MEIEWRLFIRVVINPFSLPEWPTPKSHKNCKFHFVNAEKQALPGESTAKQVPFELSYHRISSADSKV